MSGYTTPWCQAPRNEMCSSVSERDSRGLRFGQGSALVLVALAMAHVQLSEGFHPSLSSGLSRQIKCSDGVGWNGAMLSLVSRKEIALGVAMLLCECMLANMSSRHAGQCSW